MSVPATTFGQRLRDLRIRKGFGTAEELARRIGISGNTVTRYERGDVEPNLEVLARLCVVLGAAPDEVFAFSLPLAPAAARSNPVGFSEAEGPAPWAGPETILTEMRSPSSPREPASAPQTEVEAVRLQLAHLLARLVGPSDGHSAAIPAASVASGAVTDLAAALAAEPFLTTAAFLSSPQLASLPSADQQAVHATARRFLDLALATGLGIKRKAPHRRGSPAPDG